MGRPCQTSVLPAIELNVLNGYIELHKHLQQAANSCQMPPPVERAIRKLGHDLSLARRRRRISQDSMAQRMGASVSTVRRIEKGDPRIPIHFIARAMMILGDLKALENLMDTANDDIGLLLMDEQLPKRVRMPRNVSGGL